jgi:hypothetical protein
MPLICCSHLSQEPISRLGFSHEPVDRLHEGLAPSDPTSTPAIHHPVQAIQLHHTKNAQKQLDMQLARTYGTYAPLRHRLEQRMLATTGRLPVTNTGLQSSRLGWEIVTGKDEDIEMKDYLGLQINDPTIRQQDIHTHMEKQLGDAAYKRFS